MENPKLFPNTYNILIPQKQKILRQSHNIISNCDQSVTESPKYSQNTKGKKQFKLPAYIFDPNQPNIQDKQLIDKYVQKLRANSKFVVKAPSIRKSELVQNQLVFTHEQELKLEVIDEFLQRGFELPQDPFNIELFPTINQYNHNKEKKNQIDNNQSQQNQNIFAEELKQFTSWGQYGNKQKVIHHQKLSEETKTCIKNINLKSLQKQNGKDRRKKQLKILTFCKNPKFSLNKLKNKQKERVSLEVDQQIKKIPPQVISQFETEKYIQLVNQKIFPTISTQNEKQKHKLIQFNKKQFDRFYSKKKICQLTSITNNKYLKMKASAYMTPQRIQALYGCELIRGAKQIMSNKQYINLKIIVEKMPLSSEQKRVDQNYFDVESYPKRKQKEKELGGSNEQVEKILQKNKERLKIQKQRVIERLRC